MCEGSRNSGFGEGGHYQFENQNGCTFAITTWLGINFLEILCGWDAHGVFKDMHCGRLLSIVQTLPTWIMKAKAQFRRVRMHSTCKTWLRQNCNLSTIPTAPKALNRRRFEIRMIAMMEIEYYSLEWSIISISWAMKLLYHIWNSLTENRCMPYFTDLQPE